MTVNKLLKSIIFIIFLLFLSSALYYFFYIATENPLKQYQGVVDEKFKQERCGDGICDEFELNTGVCVEDCFKLQKIIMHNKNLIPYTSPLYISIIIHAEEDTQGGTMPKPQIPDYDGNEKLFLHFTKVLRVFAQMAKTHNAKINFGTDWTFAQAVKKYDPSFFTELQSLGHEIDAHAHETNIMYNEVRNLIKETGAEPTAVASGMREDQIAEKLKYFDQYYPAFSILWGIAQAGHGQGEIIAPYVWRPDSINWLAYNPKGKYIYIGSGEGVNNIDNIINAVKNRKDNYINTYSLFLTPRELKAAKGTPGIAAEWTSAISKQDYWENKLQWWDDFLSEIDKLAQQGEVQYVSLTEVADIFAENEINLNFNFGEHTRSELPSALRNKQAGYPE